MEKSLVIRMKAEICEHILVMRNKVEATYGSDVCKICDGIKYRRLNIIKATEFLTRKRHITPKIGNNFRVVTDSLNPRQAYLALYP